MAKNKQSLIANRLHRDKEIQESTSVQPTVTKMLNGLGNSVSAPYSESMDTLTGTSTGIGTSTNTDTYKVTGTDISIDTDTNTFPSTGTDPSMDTDANTFTSTETNTSTGMDSGIDTEISSNTVPLTGTYTVTNTDTDTLPNTYNDTNMDTDTNEIDWLNVGEELTVRHVCYLKPYQSEFVKNTAKQLTKKNKGKKVKESEIFRIAIDLLMKEINKQKK